MDRGTGGTTAVIATYGLGMPFANKPDRTGYYFGGYYSRYNGGGTKYYDSTMNSVRNYDIKSNTRLYAYWTTKSVDFGVFYIEGSVENNTQLRSRNDMVVKSNAAVTFSAPSIEGYTFKRWDVRCGYPKVQPKIYTYSTSSSITISYNQAKDIMFGYRNLDFYAIYSSNCVTEGTLITLADGSQKAVETLAGNEMLLVWDLKTGTFGAAPILFIDTDAAANYEIIHAYFSDGTSIKIIGEHAFYDFDLNKYVFFRRDAYQYLGHWFNKQTISSNGQMLWERVQLVDVQIYTECTTAWSPVTYEYLCYYVNGMLSMPGGTTGLINIFEVNAETMQYDQEAMRAAIEEYGLFTYEEFAKIFPVPEIIFEAFNGQYLKVAIGKGLMDYETLGALIARYSKFF